MLKLLLGGQPPNRALARISVGSATGLILVLFLSCLTGCGAGTPLASSLTPANLSAERSSTPGNVLSVEPQTLDFGRVQHSGGRVERTIRVTNVTSAPLHLRSVSVAPSTAFTIQNAGPVLLPPNASVPLRVVFSPIAVGSYSGTLAIVSQSLVSVNSRPSSTTRDQRGGNTNHWIRQAAVTRVALFGKRELMASNNPGSGNGAGNSSNGSGSSAGSGSGSNVSLSISPTSLNVRSGSLTQFNIMLKGTSNTGVTWSAALGTISSSGLYTAPTVNNQTVDTVSAVSVIDPSKYATATVVVRGGVGGPFTITNQQPISMVPNASSLFGKRLPADVMSHLYPNSDTIAQQMLAASKPPNGNFTGMIWAHAGHSNDIDGIPTYYGQASDPAYVITGGNSPSGPHNAINVPFHAPIGAQTSGATSEQYFTVWDQTQNIVISFYTCCGNGTQILPNCTSTSLSNPCPIGINPADSMVTTLSDPQPYGIGAGNPWSSSSIFAPNGEIRVQELIQGHIYHPVVMNVLCQAAMNSGSQVGAAVFPNTTGYGAGSCNYICPPGAGCTNVSNPPSAGMLVFLDYSDSDLAQLQGYLPPWQYPIIEALSHYGGYIGDTGNALHPSRLENDSAYATARVTNPLWSWIQGQPGTNSGCGPNGDCVLYWNQYNGTYGSCPASSTPNLCDVSAHLHVADPCVAKGLAGITAAQGACF